MKRALLVTGLLLVTSIGINAQNPIQLLDKLHQRMPIEKAFLQLDRDQYKAGDTIWYKAYLNADFLPDTMSSVLYVQLNKKGGDRIITKISPVLLSTAQGFIELSDSLVSGDYFIKAFSPTMLNAGTDFVFQQSVLIKGKKKQIDTAMAVIPKPVISFFSEGGNFVAGISNSVAFKCIDQWNRPVNISLSILNSANDTITSATTVHDGMGVVDMTPLAPENYRAVFSYQGQYYSQPLPTAMSSGVSVTFLPHPQGSYFEFRIAGTSADQKPAYMLGQWQHQVVFKQNLNAANNAIQGMLDTRKLHSGILQITLFNKDNMPLAERLVFVDNKEYVQSAELKMDTLSVLPRGKNVLQVNFPDTVQGSFSVAVTDADYAVAPQVEQSIISSFLLSSDIKGIINNPSWYFSSDEDSVKTALDLLLMTQGWRRFSWKKLDQQASAELKYKDPSFITVTGKVTMKDSNKPIANKQLLAIMTSGGKGKNSFFIQTDEKGNFKLDSLLFFGQARIYLMETIGKKSQYIEVKSVNDSMQSVQLKAGADESLAIQNIKPAVNFKIDTTVIDKGEGLLLQGITVKAIKKTPLEEVEDRYTSGMFSGMSNRSIDLVNTNETITDLSIFEYLQNRVPGIDMTTDGGPYGGEYVIYYRQGASVSSMGPIPMTIFLNEVETDATVVASIPPSDIALVKLYSSFPGATGNGGGGVLAIYTKKGTDQTHSVRGDAFNYKGFSIRKEFYSPDYSQLNGTFLKNDRRVTLQWIPNLFISQVNAKIPIRFYNSDRTQRFRVVLEGMTYNGKLVHAEKVFSVEKK
jgi:hypothetical protein